MFCNDYRRTQREQLILQAETLNLQDTHVELNALDFSPKELIIPDISIQQLKQNLTVSFLTESGILHQLIFQFVCKPQLQKNL